MNKTFKVARSLTRGTVVTSEAASSRQGKALKTVVAAVAAALVGGAAMAASTVTTIDKEVAIDTTKDMGTGITVVDGGKLIVKGQVNGSDTENVGAFVINGGEVIVDDSQTGAHTPVINASSFKQTAGTLTVKGSTKNWDNKIAVGGYFTFEQAGGTINVGPNGYLWIGGSASTQVDGEYVFPAMKFSGGTLNLAGKDANWAVVSTMTLGNYLQPNDTTKYNQALIFSGTTVNVTGPSVLLSRDIQLSAGSINVTKNAVLNLHVEKNLDSKGELTLENSKDSTSFNEGTVTQTGGVMSVAQGGKLFVAHNDYNLNGGSFTNAGTVTAHAINVDGGKLENTGNLKAESITITSGEVSTITKTVEDDKKNVLASLDVNKIIVKEDGTLNLLTLNSDYKASTTPDGLLDKDYKKTFDQYLVKNELTLNGGKILQNGSALKRIKVGTDTDAGTLTLNGDYTFTSLVVGQKGTVTNSKTLNVTTLNLSGLNATNDATGSFTNSGTLTVGEVVVTNEVLDANKVTNSGTVVTSYKNLAAKSGDKWALTAFGKAIAKDADGTIIETDVKELTVDQLKAAQGENGFSDIIFKNAKIVAGEGDDGKLTLGNLETSHSTTVVETGATATVKKDTTVGGLSFTNLADAKEVTVGTGNDADEGAQLALTGDAQGNVFSGLTDQTVKVTGNLALGSADAEVLGLGAVKVANKLFVQSGATLTTEGQVSLAGVENYGTLAVEGDTVADYVTGGKVVVSGSMAVTGQYEAPKEEEALMRVASNETDETPASKGFKVQSSYVVNGTADAPAFLTFGEGSKAFNAAAAKAVSDAGMPVNPTAILALDRQIDLTNGGILLGGEDSDSVTSGTINVKGGSTTAVVLDVKSIVANGYDPKTAGSKVINAGANSNIDNVVLTNLTKDGFVLNEDKTFTMTIGVPSYESSKLYLGTDFYEGSLSDGKATVKVNEGEVKAVKDAGLYVAGDIEKQVRNMTFTGNALTHAIIFGNEANDAFWEATDAQVKAVSDAAVKALKEDGIVEGFTVDTEDYSIKLADGNTLTDAQKALIQKANDQMNLINKNAEDYEVQSINTAANMAVLGGAFTTALDINDQVTGAIARRTSLSNLNVSRNEAGLTPWVDVFGSANEAKRLYGNGMGYESDIYGAVFGFDYTAACGGVLGLAVNVGTADANSVGDGLNVDSDTDFYGVSVYAAKQFGSFNVQADLGYTQTSNDLSTKGAYGAFSESLDADVFTFGVGTEFLASAGAVNVVPHAGIRLTTIDMDASEFGADYDKMTVYQLPLGVTFSGNFETGAWKVSPMVDLSVVPTFGDKDAVASYIGHEETTRVVDTNPVQAKLGVAAQNGAWTFGINYGLTAGGDDRMNNSFNANVRYTF